jgi:putative hemolysin
MAEIALVSARKARIQQQAITGNTWARTALSLAHNAAVFLSSVQMWITLIGIIAGTFGGATIATKRATELHRITVLEPYSEVLGITDLSRIMGKFVPKQLALKNPERMAMAPLMHLLSRLASPIGWVLSSPTHAFLRLLRIRPVAEPPATEAEIHAILQAAIVGALSEAGAVAEPRAVQRQDDSWPVDGMMAEGDTQPGNDASLP